MPDTPHPPTRLLPLGDSAWTVEFGRTIDPAIHARVMGLAEHLAQRRRTDPLLVGVLDVVPSLRSLTVHYDPWHTDAAALGAHLLACAQRAHSHTLAGRLWHLPVCFDADFAPDLPRLAQAQGLNPAAVIELLLGASLRVYMLGFQPGFAYMGGLPAALHLPRLRTPRAQVPAQSVAVAGDMCAIYPWNSPGGWHLLGRTPVQMFDLRHADQPALLSAGDEVRWHAVDRATHDALATAVAQGLPRTHFLKAPPP